MRNTRHQNQNQNYSGQNYYTNEGFYATDGFYNTDAQQNQQMYYNPNYQQFPPQFQPQQNFFTPKETYVPPPQPEPQGFNFGLPNEVIASTAVKYGADVMEQGSEYLQRNIQKYVPTSTLKYYFAVDNSYVAKKLLLLLFPFVPRNWKPQYNEQDNQLLPPRYDINAPDLYIPMMALLTYILNCGLMFGIGNKFSPDQLGVMASKAVVWIIAEIVILMITLYIVNARTSLRYMDMIAFSGYKFVGMNVILLLSLLFPTIGYNLSMVYFSLSLDYFLIRTLKIQVAPRDEDSVTEGNKRRFYLLLVTTLLQPLIMWMLTRSVVNALDSSVINVLK